MPHSKAQPAIEILLDGVTAPDRLTIGRETLSPAMVAADLGRLAEQLGLAVAFLDTDLMHCFVSPAYAALCGNTVDAMQGASLEDVLGSEASTEHLPRFRLALLGDEVTFEVATAGVEPKWSEWSLRPRRGEGGDVEGLSILVRDCTRSREAEISLQAANAALSRKVAESKLERDRIWATAQDLLVVANAAGEWLNVNPATLTSLGWRKHELTGRTSEWLEPPDDWANTKVQLAHVAAGQRAEPFESRLADRRGNYWWISWRAVLNGEYIYLVGRDVTSERAAALELDAAQEQLRQAQKMEAIGQLTGGIAHDFNNLLTGIIGSLDLMRRKLESGRVHEVARYIATATASVELAAALTHRLLAFSRRQALNPKPLDANGLVASMGELLRRTVGSSIRVETVLAERLWQTYSDANQLEAALLNVAINARDAMPEGGLLRIETANVEVLREEERAGLAAGSYVAILVSDTGTGMADGVIERVFEPFFTTKAVGEGTGLGLSMVYGFFKQSGGHVSIDSVPGEGTTVRLYLPRYAAKGRRELPDEIDNALQGKG